MIHFRNLRYKNFCSVGNAAQEVRLDAGGLVLIIGKNGSGKSTIVDALCFGLFGRPYRKVRRDQLVNSINEKGAVVEIEFDAGGRQYLIRRGIKPSMLELIIDGEPRDSSGTAETQREIESILGFDHETATRTMVVAARRFVPFMRLNAAQRRSFVEDVLGLDVFSVMGGIARVRASKAARERQEAGTALSSLQERLTATGGLLRGLESDVASKKKDRSKEKETLDRRIVARQSEAETVRGRIRDRGEPEATRDMLVERKNEYRNVRSGIVAVIDKEKKTAKFFRENDVCPTCDGVIDAERRDSQLEILTEKITERQAGVDRLDKHLGDFQEKINALNVEIQSLDALRRKQRELEQDIAATRRELAALEREASRDDQADARIVETRERMAVMESEIKGMKERYDDLTKQAGRLAAVKAVLADDAAKAALVKRYIPIINEKVNRYLREMNFFVDFSLDQEFNETILSRHRDGFSYDSFSEGERDRIDLAMLLTWRDIGATRSSIPTNLLILDEAFDSSVDEDGVADLTRILRSMASTVMVISHRKERIDGFERVLRFEKTSGFSVIRDEVTA